MPTDSRRTAASSAYGRVEDRVRTLTAGFAMHVVKPADPAELAAVVARVAAAR
jgi:DNA-binding response OmpR family regulator